MLGENIRNLREERGLTQKDVVDKAKELKGNSGTFTQPQLSKWEKNETLPSDDNIELLSKIFNCSKVDLKKENTNKYSWDEIYQEAFSMGRNFKTEELQIVIYNASETKKCYEDRVKYLTEFLMKNTMSIPKCFVKIMALCKDNNVSDEMTQMYYAFIIGFWNGSFKQTKLENNIEQ